MGMGPSPVASDPGAIALLSALAPILAVVIVLAAMPPVRRIITDRLLDLRLYFEGPTLDTSSQGDTTEGANEDVPVEHPSWLDFGLYDEDDEDESVDPLVDDPLLDDSELPSDEEVATAPNPDAIT